MSSRRGFTFIEILIVMIVIGILAGLATLRYIDLRNRAVASGVATELNGIRLAAYNYWADHESWPPETGPGVVPPGLATYLRQGFTFNRPQFTLDWENFMAADGSPSAGNGVMQLGVTATSADPSLMSALAASAAGGAPYFVIGNTLTYIIVGPNEGI